MAHGAHRRTSARGRHRKPNHYARRLGLATAPFVAAIPMATASPASAASSSWERLAQCESGGNWGINTGNGYYGGLQFADGTWDGYGGERFASRADLASKAEQIVIAAKLLDNSGWGPWPACSSRLGLGADDKREALATAAEYKQRIGGAQSNGDATQAAGSQADGGQADGSKAQSQPDRTAAEKRAEDNRSSTERATRGKHRTAASAGDYTVRPGDTLSGIARKRDVPGGWQALYRINRDTIGNNPGLIFPGQRLDLG